VRSRRHASSREHYATHVSLDLPGFLARGTSRRSVPRIETRTFFGFECGSFVFERRFGIPSQLDQTARFEQARVRRRIQLERRAKFVERSSEIPRIEQLLAALEALLREGHGLLGEARLRSEHHADREQKRHKCKLRVHQTDPGR
jgi:hypothetical protein